MRRTSEQTRVLTAQPVSDVDVADAVRIIDDSGVAPFVDAGLRKRRGRPRAYPAERLLSLLMLTALVARDGLHMAQTSRICWGLTASQLTQLGCDGPIAYSAVESFVADLVVAFDERVDPFTGQVYPPAMGITVLEFMNRLVRASVQGVMEPTTAAIDSFPAETWARRRVWKKPRSHSSHDDGPTTEPGWPRRNAKGRLCSSHDPDARDLYVASKNLEPKKIRLGYEVHLLCDTNARGEAGRPPLCRGINHVPGGTPRAAEGLALLDCIRAMGATVDTIIADRGYTYATVDNWALPLARRGISQILDLHALQGQPAAGPIPGTILIDGTLFVDWIPKHLWSLPRRRISDSAGDIAALCRRYDERLPYAFTAKGKPDHQRGVQQYRGPATTQRVRCANSPATMRLPISKPECPTAARGKACACAAQPRLGPHDNLALRQKYLYGTTPWKADYSRRNSIESLNSSVSHHHGSFDRNAFQVFGQNKRFLFASLSIAATNVHLMRSRYEVSPSQITKGQIIQDPVPRPASKESLNQIAFRTRPARRELPTEPASTQEQPPSPPRTIPL